MPRARGHTAMNLACYLLWNYFNIVHRRVRASLCGVAHFSFVIVFIFGCLLTGCAAFRLKFFRPAPQGCWGLESNYKVFFCCCCLARPPPSGSLSPEQQFLPIPEHVSPALYPDQRGGLGWLFDLVFLINTDTIWNLWRIQAIIFLTILPSDLLHCRSTVKRNKSKRARTIDLKLSNRHLTTRFEWSVEPLNFPKTIQLQAQLTWGFRGDFPLSS